MIDSDLLSETSASAKVATRKDEKVENLKVEECKVLPAQHVYILMNHGTRIARNKRAEWFFEGLKRNKEITFEKKSRVEECEEDLNVVSIIPFEPPEKWSHKNSHQFRYRITKNTLVSFLSRTYKLVLCVDISPSASAVDVQAGNVIFDGIYKSLKNTLQGLIKPFRVPGCELILKPSVYVTVIAHTPFLASVVDQVLVQGYLLNPLTLTEILKYLFEKLNNVENKIANFTCSINSDIERAKELSNSMADSLFAEEKDISEAFNDRSSMTMTPDFGVVDLLREGLIALSLLPENSTAGLLIFTDGVFSVPDGGYLEMILSQLRYNTVSCSFIHMSSSFHPNMCFGAIPYVDLLRFMAMSTSGAFLSHVPDIEDDSNPYEMNFYHKAFLVWNFQEIPEPLTSVDGLPQKWRIKNKFLDRINSMPTVKKQLYETTLCVHFMKVLSCRLREGFKVKTVNLTDNNMEIVLVLSWKFSIFLEYVLITPLNSESSASCSCIVSLEGPYEFLHDVTCLAQKQFDSYYRQLMVDHFWAARKNLQQADELLIHFSSFSSNPSYFNAPESLKNGLPLFHVSSFKNGLPSVHAADVNNFGCPPFVQFWKPVCVLDTLVWQKWMHTHRIGLLLEHDYPLPKNLHMANSSGRFHTIQCRQTHMALISLLREWCSFVLVENHSYIKLVYQKDEKTPLTFYIVRVTSKAPYVVIRLAFLVGTPSDLRKDAVSCLLEKIANLSFPQRLKDPPKWRVIPNVQGSNDELKQGKKATWSDLTCCIILKKPIEKILIRYDHVPQKLFQTMLPQYSFETSRPSSVASVQSTYGFKPTYPTTWGSVVKMGPELFNTVARYLHHRRWIWTVQDPSLPPIGSRCAASVLSTLIKMRLQEGFRFAYSSGGIINMIIELEMIACSAAESNEDDDPCHATCVMQYVVFPPVSSLDTEDDRDSESSDGTEKFHIVTECWIEPQFGKVRKMSNEISYLNAMNYSEIPGQLYDVDIQCISSLVTYELVHLLSNQRSSSARSDGKLNRPDIPIGRKGIESYDEERIKVIPLTCKIGSILHRSQQIEIRFSLFTEIDLKDLANSSMQEATIPHLLEFCEIGNKILYEVWCSKLEKFNDAEVPLNVEEQNAIYEMIISRSSNPCGVEKAPRVPQWRAFVKKMFNYHNQCYVTVIPSSLSDLKLFLRLLDQKQSSVVYQPEESSNDLSHDESQDDIIKCINGYLRQFNVCQGAGNPLFDNLCTRRQSTATATICDSYGTYSRKRIRVQSGGESGPPLKRISCSDELDFEEDLNALRGRAKSVGQCWKGKKPTVCKNSTPDEGTGAMKSSSDPKIRDLTSCAHARAVQTFRFPVDYKLKFSSVFVPLFMYQVSLGTLIDHVIFKTLDGSQDQFIDYRVKDSCGFDEEVMFSGLNSARFSDKSFSSSLGEEDMNASNVQDECENLRSTFLVSFIRGTFCSLQRGLFVAKNDLRIAIENCQETTIELDLTEFIKTICGHSKSYPDETCQDLHNVQLLIKNRFQNLLIDRFSPLKLENNIHVFKLTANELIARAREVKRRRGSIKYKLDEKPTSTYKSTIQHPDDKLGNGSYRNEMSGLGSDERKHCNFRLQHIECQRKYDPISDSKMSAFDFLESDVDPLFLKYRFIARHGDAEHIFIDQNIPTCMEEAGQLLDDVLDNFSMEFSFLTSPVDDSNSTLRSDISGDSGDDCIETPYMNISLSADEDQLSKDLPKMPKLQSEQINSFMKEMRWMLKDEVTFFRCQEKDMTESILASIEEHVLSSEGKPGCAVRCIKLNFVNDQVEEGFKKFKQKFSTITVDKYRFQECGKYFYVVDTKPNRRIELMQKHASVDKGSKMGSESEDISLSTELTASEDSTKKLIKKFSHDCVRKPSSIENIQETGSDTLHSTPCQMSEVSSLVESFVTNEEGGYEGDGSDSGEYYPVNDTDSSSEAYSPPFWIIFKVLKDSIYMYSHCRCYEENMVIHKVMKKLRDQLVEAIVKLKKYVNQDLLLQELHDKKLCNELLEPDEESFSDGSNIYLERSASIRKRSSITSGEQFLPTSFSCEVVWETKFILHSRLKTGRGSSLATFGIQTLQNTLIPFEVTNRKNMYVYQNSSGNVFYIRLYSYQEVDNSKRLPPAETSSNCGSIDLDSEYDAILNRPEDIVVLKVFGINPPDHDVKDIIVQSLKNKLDDTVLDELSKTLERSPHCKLTHEDVYFVQKPFTKADITISFRLKDLIVTYLSSFLYYLHQNLLQILFIPKYMDSRPEYRFRDYSSDELNDKNIYLFVQSPGGTGSRGIACLAFSLMDHSTGLLREVDYKPPESFSEFEEAGPLMDRIEAIFRGFLENDDSLSSSDDEGSVLSLVINIWKQGRINVDLLKGTLCDTLKHSLWDLVMENKILVHPLCAGKVEEENRLESSIELSGRQLTKQGEPACVGYSKLSSAPSVPFIPSSPFFHNKISLHGLERRSSVVLPLSNNSSSIEKEFPRLRSFSVCDSSLTVFISNLKLRSIELIAECFTENSMNLYLRAEKFRFKFIVKEVDPKLQGIIEKQGASESISSKMRQLPDAASLGLTKTELGEVGTLHGAYEKLLRIWAKKARDLNVPSIRTEKVDYVYRDAADKLAFEIERLIRTVAPDNDPKLFRRQKKSAPGNIYFPVSCNEEEKNISAGSSHPHSVKCTQAKNVLIYSRKLLNKPNDNPGKIVYPQLMLQFFKDDEDFDPAYSGDRFIIIARNFVHWKASISPQLVADSVSAIHESVKPVSKFPTHVARVVDPKVAPSSSTAADKRALTFGIASLLKDTNDSDNDVVVVRQRLLKINVSSTQIRFFMYNWSKDSAERLLEQSKWLLQWNHARSSLLCSIQAQKCGLFHNQPFYRSNTPTGSKQKIPPFIASRLGMEVLVHNTSPVKEFCDIVKTGSSIKKSKLSKSAHSFLTCYRNVLHGNLSECLDCSSNFGMKKFGNEMLKIIQEDKREKMNSLFQQWLMKGPSASNSIGLEIIPSFKQSARLTHFCMTPLIFFPKWRTAVAATRDNTLLIVRKPISLPDTKRPVWLKGDSNRSRHTSGTSQKSLESQAEGNKSRGRSSIWGLLNTFSASSSNSQEKVGSSSTPQNSLDPMTTFKNVSTPEKLDEIDDKWHLDLCHTLMQEYMQYLQTLGFFPIKDRKHLISRSNSVSNRGRSGSGQIQYHKERMRNVSGTSAVSAASSVSGASNSGMIGTQLRRGPDEEFERKQENGGNVVHYLQKSLPGGLLLFEVGICEPFFYAKIYGIEASRIHTSSSQTSQNLISFLDECDRMKILMHLHSFTYDYHLRCLHSYISGRSTIFKQGYHLTSFLDDFIKYYPKGPNFARNTVYVGAMTLQNISTPSQILFNYMLSHDKLYSMRVISMNPLEITSDPIHLGSELINEYILIHNSSKIISYRDKKDENQVDEFDLTLLIANDTPPYVRPYSVDPSVLRIKYYIVLTSRRELYPKPKNESNSEGKFCEVNTPEPVSKSLISARKESIMTNTSVCSNSRESSRRPSVEDEDKNSSTHSKTLKEGSTLNSSQVSDHTSSFEGIREEKVNYMGYFSSHEQMMKDIVVEQAELSETFINQIVQKAAVDCRRDLLWQRLLVGGKVNPKQKNKKEDLISRETVGALSYWEFSELLELVKVTSLVDMDKRLKSLIKQPINFYEALFKQLKQESHHYSRLFEAPDRPCAQLAVFSPTLNKCVVLVQYDAEKYITDISIVFKQASENIDVDIMSLISQDEEIYNLIEFIVNSCCYCAWANLI